MGVYAMMFPDTVEEFMEQNKMVDIEQIYSNGCEYVPIYRMKQWFAHKPQIDLVRCGECKHKPIKHDPEGDEYGFNLVSPNGYDNLCPCLNTDDGFYSYMPDDNFFCAFGERRADGNTD